MDRRTMISVLAGVVATPSFAQLSKSPSPDAVDSKPYDVLQPAIAADRKRVRLLFAYDCPFCLRYHNGLVSWGASLPKSVTFDAFPVIANLDNESVPMAIVGRLIGQALDPKVLPAYDYAMFTAIQGDPQTGAMPKGVLNMDQVLNALVEAGSEQDFNVCFVLDFSGSISDTNVSTMLNAVKTAAATLFNEASGDVAVQIVAFSGTASDYPVVTSLADLTTLLNSLNPTVLGGHRPYDGMTDFTAAVTEVMNEFTKINLIG